MRRLAIVTVFIIALIGMAYGAFRYVDRTRAQPVRDASKMLTVRGTISEALSAYYQQHGSYPHSLGELPLQTLRWGDEGSSARDVEPWTYVSDGSSFTMTWTNTLGMDLFLGGKAGQIYYSKDEKR